MSLFTFTFLLAVAVFAAWWAVNAAYNSDDRSSADQDTAERIRRASRCGPGYTPPLPGLSRACRPAHDTVKAFYAALPDHVPQAGDNRPALLDMWTGFLFVVDHPEYRLRYAYNGNWRVTCDG